MLDIASFDRNSALHVKTLIERKLKEIEAEVGVTLKVTKFSLATSRTMIVETAISIGLDVKLEDTAEGRAFIYNAAANGISKEALGETFYERGTPYIVKGWKHANFKYPIIGERLRDGVAYKFPVHTIKRHFPLKAA